MMNDQAITISQEQAAAFATALYSSIRDYIRAHEAEFEEWLKQRKEAAQ